VIVTSTKNSFMLAELTNCGTLLVDVMVVLLMWITLKTLKSCVSIPYQQ